ncbi:MAG: DUF488 domain-containing protein [Planctomycetes bacterium]|nr:DUF488 domain-containing protein [Planctomycetota bacterium]
MLKRQKILLNILNQNGGKVSHVKLVKIAFLLSREDKIGDGIPFYDFVPYKYGPFSFALYRELATLERDGYIQMTDRSVEVCDRLAAEVAQHVQDLPRRLQSEVSDVVRRYARMSSTDLLRNVYCRFPWYATASERRDLVPASVKSDMPVAQIAVYTVGYEGKSIDRFFDELLRLGIRAILDVRANPVSRKYGFARKSMRDISSKLGLGYHHLPELGIPSSERGELSDFDSYQRLLDRYEAEMLPSQGNHMTDAIRLLKQEPSALLCVEKDVRCCHRGRLADALASRSGLSVIHL